MITRSGAKGSPGDLPDGGRDVAETTGSGAQARVEEAQADEIRLAAQAGELVQVAVAGNHLRRRIERIESHRELAET